MRLCDRLLADESNRAPLAEEAATVAASPAGRCNEIVHEAVTLLTRKHKSRKGRISGFEGEDGEDRTLDGVREVLHQADRLGFEASEVVCPLVLHRL